MVRSALSALVAVAAVGCYERGGPSPSDHAEAAAPPPAEKAPEAAPALAGAPDPDATIRIALEAEPATLNPFVAADDVSRRLLRDVYEGLLCPGARPADPPIACLAARWTVSADGRVWRFALRPGVRFHDGAPVTAADAAFSFSLLVGPARSYLAAELDDLRSATADGDDVVLTFAAARPVRAEAIAQVPVVPRRAFASVDVARAGALEEAALGRAPVGTGPLRFVTWRRGEGIELIRWDGYWGAPAAAARVVYRVVADRAEALRRLGAGALDVVYQVGADDAVRFSDEHPGVVRFRYLLPAYLAAVYNARRPALAAADVRRGLTAVLDRATVRDVVLGGAAAITGPFPPGDPGIDPEVFEVPFDPALARRLVPGKPRLTVLVPQGSRASARIADIWAADAKEVATLVVEEVPFADLVARLREGRFEIAITSLTTGPELDLWPRFHSRAPPDEAWSGLRDPALDRRLDELRAALDPARRAFLRRAVHRRIAELVPMAFIAADARQGLAAAGVGGLGAGDAGPPRARDLWRKR